MDVNHDSQNALLKNLLLSFILFDSLEGFQSPNLGLFQALFIEIRDEVVLSIYSVFSLDIV